MPGTITDGVIAGTLTPGEANLVSIIQVCEANHPHSYGEFFAALTRMTSLDIPSMPGHQISVQNHPYKITVKGPFFNVVYTRTTFTFQ